MNIKNLKDEIYEKERAKIFATFLKNEFGDYIMQLILKDSYPTLPPPLELEFSDQNSIKNYLECLKNNIFSNEGPSTVFRIDISIEEKKFNGLAISIFQVRRFKFLYRNKNPDSIEKVIIKIYFKYNI